MKMRVAKDSPTGRLLLALLDKATECRKAAKQLAEAQGWPMDIARSSTCVAGGIIGLAFAEKPEGWRQVYAEGKQKYYYPMLNRKASKDALQQLESLPRLSVFEWNRVVGWDGFLSRYGLIEAKDYLLLHFPEARLTEAPAPQGPDFEEITNLEYEQLKAAR